MGLGYRLQQPLQHRSNDIAGAKDGTIMLWDLRIPGRPTETLSVKGALVKVEVRFLAYNPGKPPALPHGATGLGNLGLVFCCWMSHFDGRLHVTFCIMKSTQR